MLNVSKIKGVIWDYDGVLHQFLPFQNSLDHFDRAAVDAYFSVAQQINHMPRIIYQKALEDARDSFNTHGLSIAVFTRILQDHAPDSSIIPELMHLEVHKHLNRAKTFTPLPNLTESFERVSHLKHVILTQASCPWTYTGLEETKLTRHFTANAVIGFETCQLKKKSRDELPIRLAIEASGLPPENLLMVEDSKGNLPIPHRLGLQTALIENNGLEDPYCYRKEEGDDFITESFPTAIELLRKLEMR